MFPIPTLGDRIRQLRKQQKMTLEALAGDELTKGMLSLIENNKAKPSMESLAYIASRLGVEVSELLDEVSIQEVRKILEQAESVYNKISADLDQAEQYHKEIIEIIASNIEHLSNGYENARLLDLYSRAHAFLEMDEWKEYSERAAKIYEQMNLVSRRGSIGVLRAMQAFKKHDYQASLEILLSEREELERKFSYIDAVTRLDYDYYEAILHLATGDVDSARNVLEQAIEFSRKQKLFYRIDDLFRIYAAYAMIFQNEEKVLYYTRKLMQYGDFADDEDSYYYCQLIRADLIMFRDQDYQSALEMLEDPTIQKKSIEDVSAYGILERGKALFGLGRIQEAMECLEQFKGIPPYVHHPFDLSIIYQLDAYKALCQLKLGKMDLALKFANAAKENIAPMPNTPIKDFIHHTFEKVRDEIIRAAIEK